MKKDAVEYGNLRRSSRNCFTEKTNQEIDTTSNKPVVQEENFGLANNDHDMSDARSEENNEEEIDKDEKEQSVL